MKDNIHFFSQNENVKKGVDLEKLGMRGRQANEFSELSLPILPGFVIDSDAASGLNDPKIVGSQKIADAIRPFVKKVQEIVGKGLGDAKNPLLFKIVVSPNLAVSNYPTLHDFGLARDTVAGFASWVGENFAAHEVLFLVRGMLAVEEKVAELERREKDRVKAVEASERCSKALKSEKAVKGAALALMDEYAPVLPAGFFDGAEKQFEIALKRVSRLIRLDEQDAGDTAILVQPMVYGNYGKDSASGAFFTRDPGDLLDLGADGLTVLRRQRPRRGPCGADKAGARAGVQHQMTGHLIAITPPKGSYQRISANSTARSWRCRAWNRRFGSG